MTLPMNVTVATIAALGAAGLFALASAVQTRALRDTERRITSDDRGSDQTTTPPWWRVLTHAVSSPWWLAGSALAVVAFGLHALALHEGNLTLVQPVLIIDGALRPTRQPGRRRNSGDDRPTAMGGRVDTRAGRFFHSRRSGPPKPERRRPVAGCDRPPS